MNNKVIGAGLILATAALAATWSFAAQQSEQPGSGFQPNAYFQMPLEKDPTRQVRLQNVILPPGAANRFHRHPGDQWWAVQEGEMTYTVRGQTPRVLKPGEFVYVPRGTIHRNQNLTTRPVRSIELNITDRDKPQTEQVPD